MTSDARDHLSDWTDEMKLKARCSAPPRRVGRVSGAFPESHYTLHRAGGTKTAGWLAGRRSVTRTSVIQFPRYKSRIISELWTTVAKLW